MKTTFLNQSLSFQIEHETATAQVNVYLNELEVNPRERQVATIGVTEDEHAVNINSVDYQREVIEPILSEAIAYANLSDFSLTESDFTIHKSYSMKDVVGQVPQQVTNSSYNGRGDLVGKTTF